MASKMRLPPMQADDIRCYYHRSRVILSCAAVLPCGELMHIGRLFRNLIPLWLEHMVSVPGARKGIFESCLNFDVKNLQVKPEATCQCS